MTAARTLALAMACACATAPRPPGPEPRPPTAGPTEARPVRAAPPAEAPPRSEASMTLGAVGDVLMHGAVKESAAVHREPGQGEETGYGWLYAQVADLLSAPDLTFANLETPIALGADRGTRSFVFNAPPAAARALRAAGVRLVSVANNHAFDQGRRGFLETLRQLDRAGLAWVGAGPPPAEAGPRLLEVKGMRLAFLAWSRFFNDDGNACAPKEPCLRAALLDPERAVAAVREAAASADAVVVSLHWGDEYASVPRPADVELAHRLAEAGALVVLGHHPHVLQPVELYRRADGRLAVIAYSLGNFVSNQSRRYLAGVTPDRVGATRDGALLRVVLARRDYGRGVRQVEVAGVDYLPLWTENDTAELDRRTNPRAKASIRVVSLDRALQAVRTEMAAMPDPVPEAERSRWVRLRQRERLYLLRRQAIAEVLGEDLQAEAPPPVAR